MPITWFIFKLVNPCHQVLKYSQTCFYHACSSAVYTGIGYSLISISRSCGSNYPKCKFICTSGNLDFKKIVQSQVIDRESNQNVFLIQKDASSSAEFELSEFEISIRLYNVRIFTSILFKYSKLKKFGRSKVEYLNGPLFQLGVNELKKPLWVLITHF